MGQAGFEKDVSAGPAGEHWVSAAVQARKRGGGCDCAGASRALGRGWRHNDRLMEAHASLAETTWPTGGPGCSAVRHTRPIPNLVLLYDSGPVAGKLGSFARSKHGSGPPRGSLLDIFVWQWPTAHENRPKWIYRRSKR